MITKLTKEKFIKFLIENYNYQEGEGEKDGQWDSGYDQALESIAEEFLTQKEFDYFWEATHETLAEYEKRKRKEDVLCEDGQGTICDECKQFVGTNTMCSTCEEFKNKHDALCESSEVKGE